MMVQLCYRTRAFDHHIFWYHDIAMFLKKIFLASYWAGYRLRVQHLGPKQNGWR